jgi:hypothetical protein
MFQKLSKIDFQWNTAIRAAICMGPMLVAYIAGYDSLLVPFGQGGFFYSTLPLPKKRIEKIMYIFLMLGVGMGFYLLGGTITIYPWISILITFIVAVTIGLMSGGKVIAPLAFSLISIFSAGLNVSDPDKLQANFAGFSFIFIFCGALSLLPFWKATDTSGVKILKPEENLKTGVRLGIGTSIALALGNIFGFAKLGWPVSAVGTIIRFNEAESKKRAKSRIIGTIGGSVMAIIFFVLFTVPAIFMILAYVFGILHSLMSKTLLGKTVFFYTVTILILYSINDLSEGPLVAAQRIAFNMIGVLIAVLVVLYPFPKLMRRLDATIEDYYTSEK